MEPDDRFDAGVSGSAERARNGDPFAREAREKIKESAKPMLNEANRFAEEQKAAGAMQAENISRSVHAAAQELEKELPQAARYVHSAADSLQNASSALRQRSIEDLVHDFSRFARNQPAAAFAGSVLAGVAVSRLLRSSRAGSDDHGQSEGEATCHSRQGRDPSRTY
jgi:hypothetical protein